jgi:hypothetical protein
MTKCWKKLGQLYVPKVGGQHPKLISHAANPLPVHMSGDVYRIFLVVATIRIGPLWGQ